MLGYRIHGSQVPEFTSQAVFSVDISVEIQWNFGTGIPKKRGTTAPSAHSKLYNIQTCPTADLEPDSNSSVMLFLVEHTHTQNLSPGFLKWPPDQDQDPIPIPIPSLIFQSKTQPKSLQTAGRHDCGRHALDLISLFAHVTSPPTDRTQTKTLTMSGHREQWFGAW